MLYTRTHDEHPDLPLVLSGHSMDSFAVQQYLLDHSADVTAAVLTGTGARHEIINETNRAEVEAGSLAWLDRITPA